MSISRFKLSQIPNINKLKTQQEIGRFGEVLAKKFLCTKGFNFIQQNVHFREGEIDLIFEKDDQTIFVEVKTRRNNKFGWSIEQITGTKLEKVRKCILSYMRNQTSLKNIRIDIVCVDIKYDYIYINHLEDIIIC